MLFGLTSRIDSIARVYLASSYSIAKGGMLARYDQIHDHKQLSIIYYAYLSPLEVSSEVM